MVHYRSAGVSHWRENLTKPVPVFVFFSFSMHVSFKAGQPDNAINVGSKKNSLEFNYDFIRLGSGAVM